MITKELWINLPVKDLTRSKEFFTRLGFQFHSRDKDNKEMAGMIVGEKNTMVMLITEDTFTSYTRHPLANTGQGSEVLFSFDAPNPEAVDELAKKVQEAGGDLFAPPEDIQGWMYGCAFADPDGHRWNMVYMDWDKMPQG